MCVRTAILFRQTMCQSTSGLFGRIEPEVDKLSYIISLNKRAPTHGIRKPHTTFLSALWVPYTCHRLYNNFSVQRVPTS